MPTVHPTASIEGEVSLADDVVVGPHCVVAGPVTIGAGCRLVGSAYVNGPVVMGAGNLVYPFATIGFAPQDRKWDPLRPGAGVVVGDSNVFRESVTIHRATSDERPTRIGSGNYFMASSHAGHDVQVGDRCTFANAVMLGGHVQVGDGANFGGGSMVHQFCRVGRGAMLSGLAGISQDLPPFFTLTATNVAGSINLIGLRRGGFTNEQIGDVRWVYRTLYRRGLSMRRAVEALRERIDRPVVAEYVAFIESARRGIARASGSVVRRTSVGLGSGAEEVGA